MDAGYLLGLCLAGAGAFAVVLELSDDVGDSIEVSSGAGAIAEDEVAIGEAM